MIGRNYLIIFIFAKMNFSVCITVYGMLDTTLAGRGHRNLLFRMWTCMLEPPAMGSCENNWYPALQKILEPDWINITN